MMWYLWAGPISRCLASARWRPSSDISSTTNPRTSRSANAYYTFRDQEQTVRRIMEEFGMDPDTSHIVNGHVPVGSTRRDCPVKAGGKLLVIDGGFFAPIARETGIAGYTLIFNSFGLLYGSQVLRNRRRPSSKAAPICKARRRSCRPTASHPRA